MVDSEYSTDNYKTLKISFGTVIKNQKMIRFVSDYFQLTKMCKHAVKNFLFVIRHVPNQYKT